MKKIITLAIMILIIGEKTFSENITASDSQIIDKIITFKLPNFLSTILFSPIFKILIVFIVIFCILFTCRHLFFNKNNKSKVRVITKSTIEKILNINELATIEYPYEGIATIYKEKHEKDEK